ncbi:hypothetical protein ACWT_5185 [Actinoplanes sp. SE50]|uniref:hypothetical protein n=1 Tax=unclassified Actinoplanes TaxID=2626549 RepID=UPI00023ED65C|nr:MULTISPECIES: hypothetical protein [unclassified Actinoplanes]AEV86202.1 hypothetical protein ACPL_5315 [Actinoplanes sp. SE50/110]ATO84600.1 hypothetical protein ACWT_5185 [Actinoplanes sp. SE50]SLM02010.1 hypothetical protein ACSP50_5248 [Actinoplanes sp. SE50/110]
MPAQPFSVHPDLAELARRDIAAALTRPAVEDGSGAQPDPADAAHHGARDTRQAARRSSDRAHAGRAAGAGGGRSYAFRRS